ncbi:exonuclease mut-7 homolog isoform X5 [Passer montanus]|nr:exonuclease mut-7 homolog isoform X5 [Passer montanus]XP_039575787.1 exonuclease mut-7 homolog isoform X5 [Passer montanus]XP_039575788.1 exonuclease mut-7 homolog isoform X5 [Passer montanus]XP_039575789.1 exonuclease mut-7 homolog isoform X5 [Passer montanus]
MLESSSDWKGKGHSLGYCITMELQLWLKAHPAVPQVRKRESKRAGRDERAIDCNVPQSGTKLKKLQAHVLGMLSQCPANLLDPLISIYQLHTADRNYLLEHVSHLYLQGNYKEAAILSIKLKLQPDQDVEKMCTPLLLQDKANLVEEYVAEYPELQRKLLQTLDTWCEPSFDIRDITRPYQGLSKYKPEKFNCRMLSKLVFRLLERFNVDPALCPNVINQRHLRTLNYLFYKRFVEKTMTEENWADHIQSTVGENRWLQGHLVQSLLRHCDACGAARWAQHCRVPSEMLPQAVAEELQKLHVQDRVEEVKKADNYEASKKKDYYQLPIPRENIHFLQTWEETLQCWEKVLQPGQVVGVDMEWKPSFGMVGKPRVALLQLALKDEVFLLDLPRLLEQAEAEGEKEKLPRFIQMLYSDAAITKLGYGMSGDLSSLAATCSALKDTEKQMQGVVDLLAVDKQLQWGKDSRKVDGLSPERSHEERGVRQPEKGLSLLVQHVLGKPLDKTEQLSNWEKRPLREEQILYAASDAYCLLEIYERLCKDPERFSLSSDLTDSLVGKQSKKPRAKKQLNKQEAPSPSGQECQGPRTEPSRPPAPISPQEFSVVCDNMLQGLGRYLRCLGVDVRLLDNEDDHRKAAEIARQEGRVILTSGLPYQTLRSQVGEGRCFSVNCSEKAKEQALQVLKHFNVQVSLGDIFSRCQVCNCNKYLKVSRESMKQLVESSRQVSGEHSAGCPGSQSCSVTGPVCDTAQPGCTPHSEQAEGTEQRGAATVLAGDTVLQVTAIPPGVLDRAELTDFYCCTCCGKVFWEGSHFGHIVSQFQDVLVASRDAQSIYELS